MLSPFHIADSYGLFAVMTTHRPEIVFEGSSDGTTWLPYEFKIKPGDDLKRPPPWVAPHMPRLDWRLWFAAMDNVDGSPWVLDKPHASGGLELSRYSASAALVIFIIACIIFLPQKAEKNARPA